MMVVTLATSRLSAVFSSIIDMTRLPIVSFKFHTYAQTTDTCLFMYTHSPFNGPFSGTTRVSRYQKGKTNLDFTEARDSEWQWHQLGHTQVCT